MALHKYLLITGAAGFVGHYLLRDLLLKGKRCAVLLRPPILEAAKRLHSLLGTLGLDVDELLRSARLVQLEGDLDQCWPVTHGLDIEAIIHAAASTRFSPASDGEPWRTNVDGTRRLLAWADELGVQRLHLVSTAYVCGRERGPAPEQFSEDPPEFHNVYEQSKWRAEALCRTWAASGNRVLQVFRPSVVVGEFLSGRAIKFDGFYLMGRATELLHRCFMDRDEAARQSIPLRIEARPFDRQNIVPVDYVSACMAAIACEPDAPGRVYHLTHPCPPSNQMIKQGLESFFGIGGGRFVEPGTLVTTGLNAHEQSFYDASRSIRHYFVDTPTFERRHTEMIEHAAGIVCPVYDLPAIHRLIAYALADGWGRHRQARSGTFSPCAAYFELFLPRQVASSRIARLTALSTTMRFIIDDEPDGQWVCRFDRGQLSTVHRGSNGIQEDFGYRSTRAAFWDAITGRIEPQELFLTGRAELFGDIERALKMAAILHEFTKECPCDPKQLAEARRS